MPRLVKEPLPFEKAISPSPRPRLTRIPPFVPAAPVWMCDAVNTVPGGNPVADTVASIVADMIVPPESLDRLNVTLAMPEALASVPVTGGTSLDVSRFVVKVAVELEEGMVDVSLHPTITATQLKTSSPERELKVFMSIAPTKG